MLYQLHSDQTARDPRMAHIGLRRLRQWNLIQVTCLLLSACSSPPSQPHAHDPLTWSAAIGRLDDEHDENSCSATLVAPDVIATAAHCVILNDRTVDATSLTFYPNLGAATLPPSQGTKLIALGPNIESDANDLVKELMAVGKSQNKLSPENSLGAMVDWALIRISPPITSIVPIAVGNFSAADIDQEIAKGATLSQAGYGVYGLSAGTHLYQQGNCRRLTDDKVERALGDYILFTSCRPIKGDSGGPLLLTKASGERYLVGVISRYRFNEGFTNRITIATAARSFIHQIPGTP